MAKTRVLVASDDFTYSDGTLQVLAPTKWQDNRPGFGTAKIVSNTVKGDYGAGSTGACRWIGDGDFSPDQWSSIYVVAGMAFTGATVGVCCRISADVDPVFEETRDFYLLYFEDQGNGANTSLKIAKIINGSRTDIASQSGIPISNGDRITLEVEDDGEGNTILRGYLNDELKITTTEATPAELTGGRPGFMTSSHSAALSLDNWEAGNLVEASGGGGTAAPVILRAVSRSRGFRPGMGF
jgi:hypothetical protein